MVIRNYITIPELAKLLGISRIAVYKKVKKGQIEAQKVGRSYVISDTNVQAVLKKKLGRKDKDSINAAIKRTVSEYGQVLKWLSKE